MITQQSQNIYLENEEKEIFKKAYQNLDTIAEQMRVINSKYLNTNGDVLISTYEDILNAINLLVDIANLSEEECLQIQDDFI